MSRERELRVLILDDDPDDVILLKDAIYDAMDPAPMRLEHVTRSKDAEEALDDGRYDLAFFDYHLGMETGLDLLKTLARKGPLPCPVIILTGQGNEEVAVDAMKAGAADYIIKDVLNPDLIALTIRRALRSDEDRRRRREAEAALERLRRQYELILRSAGDGIVGLDRTGRITFSNPAAVTLTGWDEQRIKGRDAHRVLHRAAPGGTCTIEPCPLKEAIEGGDVRESTDDTFWRSDGISIPVRYVVSPILEDGVRVGSVIAFSDTTVVRQAEEARRLATERLLELEHLKEIDQFRSQFLNTAAHELNSPLTPIKTQLHLMHRRGMDTLPTDHHHSIDVIERNIDRLGRLVQDLLDISRLQNQNFRVYREEADLARIVKDVVETHKEAADRTGVRLVAETDDEVRLRIDIQRIRQAVENLVDNALRSTPNGGEVRVTLHASGDTVRLEVTDDGIGIPEAAMGRLFRPFAEVHEDPRRAGAGLGLAISRGIAEHHGGQIWAESDGPDEGARFIITLPIEAPEEPTARGSRTEEVWGKIPEEEKEADPHEGTNDPDRGKHHQAR